MEINDIEIGLRIKEIREKSGLNKLKFAATTGADNSTLGKIEGGKSASKEILLEISSKYNISLDWLVWGAMAKVDKDFTNERIIALEALMHATLRRVCHVEAVVEKIPFEDVYQKAREDVDESLSDLDIEIVPDWRG